MQTCSCTVRLSGDVANTVPGKVITPPEYLILQSIHGADAVLDLKPKGNDKRPHEEERDRLTAIYGTKLVEKMFPGAVPNFPVDFKAVGVDLLPGRVEALTEDAKEEAPKKKPRGRPRKQKAPVENTADTVTA